MEQFIVELNQRFASKAAMYTDAGLPAMATIDKFRNQPLNPELFDYFPLPALFVNRSITWTRTGKIYNGLMTVEFHVLQDAAAPTENFSTSLEDGLKQYRFLRITREILDDFESGNTSKLMRGTEVPVDADVCIYDLLTYTCNYYEPLPVGRPLVDTAGEKLNLEKTLKEKL